PGLVLVNKIMGFDKFEQNDSTAFFTVGAGEAWDGVVERVVSLGYSGLEELSLIPGTAGATPVQNVGAYGQEASNLIKSVTAFDKESLQIFINFFTLSKHKKSPLNQRGCGANYISQQTKN
ncbi:MAG: hypothetical protein RLY75_1587, partial [Pseudomonadota bacterium]